MSFALLRHAAVLALAATSIVGIERSGAATYTTSFDGSENPISEGGAWSHLGLDWQKVMKSNGMAFGTQTGNGGYDDSYAVLSGFGPNHSATATLHLNPAIDGSCTHEVEILLRWADAAHTARGYEVNLSFDGGYAQIVRWNGALGDFTVLGGGSYGAIKEGDTFSASIEGDLITLTVNGTRVAQVRDGTWTNGNPGMGFFRRACGANSDFGFLSYTATDGTQTQTAKPMPPSNVVAQ